MNVELTDLVTCPRCGPTYGLILLPHALRERRVLDGVLGCANCRERYPIEGGVADLRMPGAGNGGEPDPAAGSREAALRLAALLDLTGGAGTVLVAGPMSGSAASVAELAGDVEVVATAPGPSGVEVAPVTVIRLGRVIPFRSGALRGVALGAGFEGLLEEGARALGPGGRLVLDPAPAGARERVEAAGLRVLAEEGGTLVAGR